MRKWLPLAPPDMPGVWSDLSNMLPTRSGSYYAPGMFSLTAASAPGGTPGTTLRAWCALLPSDSVTGVVGTSTKLYVTSAFTSFTDRSGAAYTATDWSFAQFGNITIATSRTDAVQTRDATGSSNFANASGSPPKARIVCTQSQQVLLFDLNDGAEKPDAFAACAPGDITDWSGAGATTATRILHRPGKITAAIPFRDYVLVFKQSSVYRLIYSGNSTFKWKVELIATGRGAYGKHDVVACGDVVVFRGPGGAWLYDGSRFQSITDWVGEIYNAAVTASWFDSFTQNAHFFNGGGWAYNLVADAWGARTYQTVAGASITSYMPLTGEPAAIRAIMGAGNNGTPDNIYVVDLTNGTPVLTGAQQWGVGDGSTSSYITTGVEGQGSRGLVNFSELNPRYSRTNSYGLAVPGDTELRLDVFTANVIDAAALSWETYGTPTQANVASSTEQRRFDINATAAFARFKIKAPSDSGYFEIADYDVVAEPDGEL